MYKVAILRNQVETEILCNVMSYCNYAAIMRNKDGIVWYCEILYNAIMLQLWKTTLYILSHCKMNVQLCKLHLWDIKSHCDV